MFSGNYDIKLNDKIRQRQQSKVIQAERKERENSDFYNKFDNENHGLSIGSGLSPELMADSAADQAVAEMMGEAKKSPYHKDGYVDIDPEGEYGFGDLIYAAGQGNLMRVRQIVEYVGGKEGNVNRAKWSGVTCLHRAAGEGHNHVVEYFLKECK